jgi:ubiquinone/menaquinone biosynthesis C-methylase UbiE
MNINKVICDKYYTPKHLQLKPQNAYDRYIIDLRFNLITRYGCGKDVLDLCCGTGSYLIPMLPNLNRAYALDFSPNMLKGFTDGLANSRFDKLFLLLGDATSVPLKAACVDFVFSYTSLYVVPQVWKTISEIARVLRHGGYAAIELGNQHSINTVICNFQHKTAGWAKPFHVSYRAMVGYLENAGLKIISRHSFQLLNNYGVPFHLAFLFPLAMPLWKRLLGIQCKGKILDEWLSGCWPLRFIAFRHIFVVEKR